MEAMLNTGFSLSYHDQVLSSLLPLFPPPTSLSKSPHIHTLAWLLVTLNKLSLVTPFLTSLIPKDRLLAYQFTFNLVEGGARDFLQGVKAILPEGKEDVLEARMSIYHTASQSPHPPLICPHPQCSPMLERS
ncbi:uncharacterized protein EDB91DRAFT_1257041 [Suillus paluster]|uniref:uncharacterized protein n=1 Tax=Suillus paluster TaxID=48578 RepID=UPI001B8623E8|nr:uncharacterized protein EDB91DRAFT_1257041 [Suillus paluster]KAG1720309.1 hypothetical protein EDB91DRAFT_1257041 [Suillus paluster]